MSLDLVAAVMCITLGALLACDGITAWLGTPLDPDPATWANNARPTISAPRTAWRSRMST